MVRIMVPNLSPKLLPLLPRASHLVIFFSCNCIRIARDPIVVITNKISFYPAKLLLSKDCPNIFSMVENCFAICNLQFFLRQLHSDLIIVMQIRQLSAKKLLCTKNFLLAARGVLIQQPLKNFEAVWTMRTKKARQQYC